jgi:hypothetical protein
MKICILEAAEKINWNSVIDAHVRQAITITNYLRAKGHTVFLLAGADMRGFNEKNFDVIIKSYAAFYDNFADQKRIIENSPNAKLFWLTNEYDLQIGGTYTKIRKYRPIHLIANFINKREGFKTHNFVNMNALFYEADKQTPAKKYDVCYYGTYRKNRAMYFRKYFKSKEIILSTSKKNIKKFKSIGCDFTPVDKFKWGSKYDTLGYFKYTIYIEDEYTHKCFNNLADRFYEALSNKTVILFDKSCINTLRKSEIADENWQNFIIDDFEDIKNRDYEKDLASQQKWAEIVKAERQKALEKIEEIITKKA